MNEYEKTRSFVFKGNVEAKKTNVFYWKPSRCVTDLTGVIDASDANTTPGFITPIFLVVVPILVNLKKKRKMIKGNYNYIIA